MPRPVTGIRAVNGTATVPSPVSVAGFAVSSGSSMSRPVVKLSSTRCAVPGLVVRSAALSMRPAAQSARNARACFPAAGSGPVSRSKGPTPAAYAPPATAASTTAPAMTARVAFPRGPGPPVVTLEWSA